MLVSIFCYVQSYRMWRGLAGHVVTLSIGVYLGLEFRNFLERWPPSNDKRRQFTIQVSSPQKSQRIPPHLEARVVLPPELNSPDSSPSNSFKPSPPADSALSQPDTNSQQSGRPSLLSLVAQHEPSLILDGSTVRDFGSYLVALDTCTRLPRWALESLTPEDLKRDEPFDWSGLRFLEDDGMPYFWRATNTDYARSGFDRGHLVPAADFADPEQTFVLSNTIPQVIWYYQMVISQLFVIGYINLVLI